MAYGWSLIEICFWNIIFHLQENIKEWTEFYNDDERQKTFLKIDEWFRLWEDRLQLETCMKDPKRLGNFKVSVAIHTSRIILSSKIKIHNFAIRMKIWLSSFHYLSFLEKPSQISHIFIQKDKIINIWITFLDFPSL